MKYAILASLLAVSLNTVAAQNSVELQSCDVQSQRAVVGETGGQIRDIRQAHLAVRAKVLTADIRTLRKARKLTQVDAERLLDRVAAVRDQTHQFVEQQGFLSAAENASFDREFDAIAMRLCQ
jgi:hypothetical protein